MLNTVKIGINLQMIDLFLCKKIDPNHFDLSLSILFDFFKFIK